MSSSKKKKRRLNLKNIFIILIVIASISLSTYYILNLRIKHILILGTTNIKDVEIIETAKIKNYPKIFRLNISQIEKDLKNLDLVSDVKIKRNILGKLTIEITENLPLFYYQNQRKTILSDGSKIDDTSFLGLPTIINYVPDKQLEALVKGINKIDQDILYLINEIEYSPSENSEGKVIDDTRFILYMNDGNTVYMNTVNIKKLSNYFTILDAIEEEYGDLEKNKGVLQLDSATDRYFFKTYAAIKAEEETAQNPEEDD